MDYQAVAPTIGERITMAAILAVMLYLSPVVVLIATVICIIAVFNYDSAVMLTTSVLLFTAASVIFVLIAVYMLGLITVIFAPFVAYLTVACVCGLATID